MTLLALDWRTPADDNVVAVMETTASTTLLLELPSGRHVFRLMVDAPSDWSFTASCAKEFDLGPASEIFEILGGHCAEMQKHAVTAVQALGLCLTKDLGVVKDIIAKLAQTHGVAYDVPLPMMTAVWHALLWSLEHVLVDDWTEEETVTTESVDAEGNTVKLQEKRTVLSGLGKGRLGEGVSVQEGSQTLAHQLSAFGSVDARCQVSGARAHCAVSAGHAANEECWRRVAHSERARPVR